MAVGAVGYVTAAVIAAGAAFIGVVIGKEQKTTGFRQDWINAQRSDLATMIALARSAKDLKADERPAVVRHFDEAGARVSLRENPEKHEWERVLDDLAQMRRVFTSQPATVDVEDHIQSITMTSRQLLKTEWMRVRSGEGGFKLLKWTVPALAALLLAGLAYGERFIVIAPLTLP